MTEEQFTELRDYTDGMPLSVGAKPSSSLIRNGWLRHVVDDFYEITPKGQEAFDRLRRGDANARLTAMQSGTFKAGE